MKLNLDTFLLEGENREHHHPRRPFDQCHPVEGDHRVPEVGRSGRDETPSRQILQRTQKFTQE